MSQAGGQGGRTPLPRFRPRPYCAPPDFWPRPLLLAPPDFQTLRHACDDRWQYSKKIVKCLTTTRSKKELCIFAGKIDKKSSSYCCLRSFGRSGNKLPAIKSISNTALDTTICLVAHFSKAVGTGDTRGQLTPPPFFDRMKTCYMKLPYDIPCHPRCSNLL